MKGCLKRVLGLLLVLSTSAWSQAICPTMLFSQAAEPCPTQQKALVPAHDTTAQHDCCPRSRRKTQTADPVKLTNCSSKMPCCSVDRQPAHAQRFAQTSTHMIVIGRVVVRNLHFGSPAQLLQFAEASPPTRDVLSTNGVLLI